ncbi:hypothetical protein PENTCL1PPCAC_25539, partial [Pristionchus entomophagus]
QISLQRHEVRSVHVAVLRNEHVPFVRKLMGCPTSCHYSPDVSCSEQHTGNGENPRCEASVETVGEISEVAPPLDLALDEGSRRRYRMDEVHRL